MARIMIVVGHPVPGTYCEALGEAYRRGAESGGHEAHLFLLSKMNFDAVLREGYRREQPLEPDLAHARDVLRACERLVLVFPLWLGDMPAILKGFLERVMQADLLAVRGGTGDWKILNGKSARIIMTMGMPGWFYRLWFGAYALKLLKRNILHFTGVSPIRATIHGGIESVGDDTRREWLRETEALGYAAE